MIFPLSTHSGAGSVAVLAVLLAGLMPCDRTVADEPAPAPVAIDFEAYEAGTEPDDLFVIEGMFRIAEDGGDKVLQLEPQPLNESGVIFGKSLRGAASVSVEIKATKRRRSTPRFGVGLHGISGYRLRVVPATNEIELIKSEEKVKAAALPWTSGEWLHLKLSVVPADGGKWVVSGWAWPKGKEAPAEPLITLVSDEKPGQGKASIWGTPYSGTPILYDDIVIEDLSPDGEADAGKDK